MSALKDQHCRPLRGAEHRMALEAIEHHLQHLPGWTLSTDADVISKLFRFDDYHRTMAFVNAVAWIAHQQDHHPDLEVAYNRCVVRYNTHDVGGLSINDFISAAKVEALLQ